MEINWNSVRNTKSIIERNKVVQETIDRCEPDDPIFLSDCIVKGAQEGVFVLMELANREESAIRSRRDPMTWKLLCLKDEWGNEPQPGEKVVKITPVNFRKADGSVVTSEERNRAKMDGSYSDKFELKTEYIVDERGCIEAPFTDAGYFLQRFGVHPKSNRGMGYRPEMSRDPILCPDGQKRHMHFWRFKEMTRETYEDLPLRTKTEEPKRGRPAHVKK